MFLSNYEAVYISYFPKQTIQPFPLLNISKRILSLYIFVAQILFPSRSQNNLYHWKDKTFVAEHTETTFKNMLFIFSFIFCRYEIQFYLYVISIFSVWNRSAWNLLRRLLLNWNIYIESYPDRKRTKVNRISAGINQETQYELRKKYKKPKRTRKNIGNL